MCVDKTARSTFMALASLRYVLTSTSLSRLRGSVASSLVPVKLLGAFVRLPNPSVGFV